MPSLFEADGRMGFAVQKFVKVNLCDACHRNVLQGGEGVRCHRLEVICRYVLVRVDIGPLRG